MTPLKFRTPVICHNGHKNYFYFSIDLLDIGMMTGRYDRDYVCSCQKADFGEGYSRNGADERCIILTDSDKVELYEGDVVKGKTRSGYGYGREYTAIIEYRESYADFVLVSPYYGNKKKKISRQNITTDNLKKIGSVYLNPELDFRKGKNEN